MPHIIEAIENESTSRSIESLREAHLFIASRAMAAQVEIGGDLDHWGAAAKRMCVNLRGGPDLVGKAEEKFVEIINILATTERTIEALQWFSGSYPDLSVRECHSSTSDNPDGNDIVLVSHEGEVKVRCEVCDVASRSPGQNNKEKKDLASLGCSEFVPKDGIDRYIATSTEFGVALAGPKRKWAGMHYGYRLIETRLPLGTVLLAVGE